MPPASALRSVAPAVTALREACSPILTGPSCQCSAIPVFDQQARTLAPLNPKAPPKMSENGEGRLVMPTRCADKKKGQYVMLSKHQSSRKLAFVNSTSWQRSRDSSLAGSQPHSISAHRCYHWPRSNHKKTQHESHAQFAAPSLYSETRLCDRVSRRSWQLCSDVSEALND